MAQLPLEGDSKEPGAPPQAQGEAAQEPLLGPLLEAATLKDGIRQVLREEADPKALVRNHNSNFAFQVHSVPGGSWTCACK